MVQFGIENSCYLAFFVPRAKFLYAIDLKGISCMSRADLLRDGWIIWVGLKGEGWFIHKVIHRLVDTLENRLWNRELRNNLKLNVSFLCRCNKIRHLKCRFLPTCRFSPGADIQGVHNWYSARKNWQENGCWGMAEANLYTKIYLCIAITFI